MSSAFSLKPAINNPKVTWRLFKWPSHKNIKNKMESHADLAPL